MNTEEAVQNVLDGFPSAVEATPPTHPVLFAILSIQEWNRTPDAGTAGSPYCRCGRRADPNTNPPTCQNHRP